MIRALLRRLAGKRDLGSRGERLAGRYLRRQGYRILGVNLRNRFGEIDILAETPDRGAVVIVEVKTGSGGDVRPEVHVNQRKQRQLVNLAVQIARRRGLSDRPIRFDVIGIDLPDATEPTIRHHPAAFESHV